MKLEVSFNWQDKYVLAIAPFKGPIFDAAYYTRALTAAEVRRNYLYLSKTYGS